MNTKHFIVLILILILSWFLKSNFFNVPLERDEGEYAYIAEVVQDGGLPYKDAFNQKPPLIFYTYSVIFAFIGDSIYDIHLAVFIYNLITLLFVYKTSKLVFGKNHALLSSFVFVILSAERRYLCHSANTEIFMIAPMTASWFYILKSIKQKNGVYLYLSGILAGFSVLFKQVALMSFIGAILFYIYHNFGAKDRKCLAFDAGKLAAAFMLPLAFTALYFYIKGGFSDFYYQVISHNLEYVKITSELRGVEGIVSHFYSTFKFILESQIVWWLLSFLAAVSILINKERLHKFAPLVFIFSLWGVSSGFRFTLHYFIQVIPSLSILSASGVFLIYQYLQKIRVKQLRYISYAVLITITLLIPYRANSYYYSLPPDGLSYVMYSENPFREAVKIAEYVSKNTIPDDTIFIIGSEPEILFYSKRKSASRYIFIYPLTIPYSDALEKQKEVINEVKKNSPKFIIYVDLPMSISYSNDAPNYIFKELRGILDREYMLDSLVISSMTPEYYFGKNFQKQSNKILWPISNGIYLYRLKE